MSRDARTNRRIRARELRVIGPEGEQLGILSLEAALSRAGELGLDLVEVQPMAKPPVCKIMDYGKFKYETKKRANEAKKKQVVVKVKEIKLRPRTEEHDYDVKLKQAREFLEEGHKIKVTIVFRGREIAHREIGQRQLQDMVNDLKDVASVEQAPRMEGKAMFMLLGSGKGGGARPSPAPGARPMGGGMGGPRPPSGPRPPMSSPRPPPSGGPGAGPSSAGPSGGPSGGGTGGSAPAARPSFQAPGAGRPPGDGGPKT